MVSRFKRMVSRTTARASDGSDPIRDCSDPNVLLSQVRAGISMLEVARADLSQREQELLADASALYEQLKATAQELAEIRSQQATASAHAETLQAALEELDGRRARDSDRDHDEPGRLEILAIQAQD